MGSYGIGGIGSENKIVNYCIIGVGVTFYIITLGLLLIAFVKTILNLSGYT